MSLKIEILDHSEINENSIRVATSGTSHCNLERVLMPTIEEVCKKHREMTKLAKKIGVKIIRKYQTLSIMKNIYDEAKYELDIYNELFSELSQYWKERVVDGHIVCEVKEELNTAYDKRNQIDGLFHRNTKLSEYLEKNHRIDEMIRCIKDKEQEMKRNNAESCSLKLYY
ncbi:MAG: hypothetical protein CL760_05495 [Chloroflexi bacterium]|nr:hypothetical protein [Chloroflexota bacterium]|tara:strand:- start:54402 stop:54911 length:510 start_codon:yes stop_codon:yes gene_type:complete